MPKSDDELEKTADLTSPKIPMYHLLQIVGAIVIIYAILHFLEKYW
jgi:hypothetical protein